VARVLLPDDAAFGAVQWREDGAGVRGLRFRARDIVAAAAAAMRANLAALAPHVLPLRELARERVQLLHITANASFTKLAAHMPNAQGAGRGRISHPVRANPTSQRRLAGGSGARACHSVRFCGVWRSKAPAVRRCMRCCTRSTCQTLRPRSATCSSTLGPLWCRPASSWGSGGRVHWACACYCLKGFGIDASTFTFANAAMSGMREDMRA